MFNGKTKAVTFSFDDGVTQDIRLIKILNRYGLKCTFNLNSELLGKPGELNINGVKVTHNKVMPEEVSEIYKNHEIAVHTLTHPRLTLLDEAEIIRQVEKDRENLSKLCGYGVVGMAYPCGEINNDDRVAEIIKKHTGVKYSRTITSTHCFDRQENLYRFNPTEHSLDTESTEKAVNDFIALESDEPAVLYIWGHSYEFDAYGSWEWFERLCKKISGKDDIFYGTNSEVLLADRL